MSTTTDRGLALWRIYRIAMAFNALVLVAFIAGSMVFTGGQVAEGETTKWQPVWYWPVFPVPPWLLIVPAALAALLVIPMCVWTPAERAPRMNAALGITGVAAASPVIFMLMFPADSGWFPLSDDGRYAGLHWIALALTIFCLLVVIVALVAKGLAYERLRKAGTLSQ